MLGLNRLFVDFFKIKNPRIGTPLEVLLGPYPEVIKFVDEARKKETEISMAEPIRTIFSSLNTARSIIK